MDIRQDSLTACTGSEDSTARLLNLQTGRVLGTLTGMATGFQNSHAKPQSRAAALADYICQCVILVTSVLKFWCCPAGHTDSIEAVRFIGDTSLLATCSLDGTLRIWETSYLALRATCSHPEVRTGSFPEFKQVLCRHKLWAGAADLDSDISSGACYRSVCQSDSK